MGNKREKTIKSVSKIIVTEMKMLVVIALLTQIRNVTEYILKGEVKLKVN